MTSGYSNNNNTIDEDYSESQTTMNPEQFEDEPGNPYNHHSPSNIVYPPNDPYDQRYQINDHNDDEEDVDTTTPYEENRATNENDPYGHSPHYRTSNDYDDNYDPHLPPSSSMEEQAPYRTPSGEGGEQEPPPPPRKHKYSSANLKEQGKWKKWCKILILFLIMIAFIIGLRMILNRLFFGDTSDNGPPDIALRDENGTFAKDKQEIDSACGGNTLALDEGTLCKEACIPEYFHCCDPFDELVLYNYTAPIQNTTNTTEDGKLTSDRYNVPQAKNLTFLEGYDESDQPTCTFDTNVRGCMAYAKCHALTGQTDPAPSTLLDMCSLERLKEDADSCTELCQKLDCCFSAGSDNCLAEKFDLCMDYAPCQNLRTINDPTGALEVAPRTLDYDCYYQQPSCTETCDKARCCSDVGGYSCWQYNFLSCVTYAPCSNVTEVNIIIPSQFNHVPQPSIDLVYACDTSAPVIEATDRSCEDICQAAACCWSSTPDENCFHLDPLGCLAYEAQCQALL